MQTESRISISTLLEELDRYDRRVPLEVLEGRLRCLEVDWSQIEPFVKFGADSYRRNLMHAGPAYHVLILCWKSGQRSPIHDHQNSSCALRVLRGTCTETVFERVPSGLILAAQTRQFAAGDCCGSQDADFHQISNIAPGDQDLITLHIYSPPLSAMAQYSFAESERLEYLDRVPGFAAGGGS